MTNLYTDDLTSLLTFLRTPTPIEWLTSATNHISLLLIDHAHCERKAAATAVYFISKYPNHHALVARMSPLAREELLHFEKVLAIMASRGLAFKALNPARYASHLHQLITKKSGWERLCDELLIGAIIEARSCERFAALIDTLKDLELVRFYRSLVKSEARHFKDYLYLAHLYGHNVEERLDAFLTVENALISGYDKIFRFHSGILR